MSWEARGMCLSIMAMGDFEQFLGTVSGDEDVWRAQLGFPTGRGVKSAGRRVAVELSALDQAWSDHWGPELRTWFKPVDAALVRAKPKYKNLSGRCWHPLLDTWNADGVAAKPKPRKKTGDIVPGGGCDFDYAPIRLSIGVVQGAWDTPMSQDARAALWETAVRILKTGNTAESTARTFLGKMIKDYGEKEVAAAIAQIMVRTILPADPKSFLNETLKNGRDGTPAVRKARQQRIRVAL